MQLDQAWKHSCTDQNQLDVHAEFLCPVVLPRLTRESCIEKSAPCARGGMLKFIHVVNKDTSMHAVHTSTVAFSKQSFSSVVSVLNLTDDAHSVTCTRKRSTA